MSSADDDVVPISDLLYEVPISELLYEVPIADLLYEVPISDLLYEVPISDLYYDDPGPHVIPGSVQPEQGAEKRYTPARGQELRTLLDKSIVQLGAVSGETRRRTPVPLPPPVAIETLLYRGRAALERAGEIRQGIVDSGLPPSAEVMGELLDLIALAATE